MNYLLPPGAGAVDWQDQTVGQITEGAGRDVDFVRNQLSQSTNLTTDAFRANRRGEIS